MLPSSLSLSCPAAAIHSFIVNNKHSPSPPPPLFLLHRCVYVCLIQNDNNHIQNERTRKKNGPGQKKKPGFFVVVKLSLSFFWIWHSFFSVLFLADCHCVLIGGFVFWVVFRMAAWLVGDRVRINLVFSGVANQQW